MVGSLLDVAAILAFLDGRGDMKSGTRSGRSDRCCGNMQAHVDTAKLTVK